MEPKANLFSDTGWEEADGYQSGTKQKVLRDEKGARTILLKLPGKFRMAPHSHITTEQHFVLQGEYTIKDDVYPAGTYQIFRPHQEHGPFESKEGAMILVVWDPIELNN